jgi:hypothetical protein
MREEPQPNQQNLADSRLMSSQEARLTNMEKNQEEIHREITSQIQQSQQTALLEDVMS